MTGLLLTVLLMISFSRRWFGNWGHRILWLGSIGISRGRCSMGVPYPGPRYSMPSVLQVQIVARTLSVPLSAPLFCAKWLQRTNLCAPPGKKKEELRNSYHFNINKARYPSLVGMGFLSSLLAATVLVRNHTIRWQSEQVALGGAYRSCTPSIISACQWRVAKNHSF